MWKPYMDAGKKTNFNTTNVLGVYDSKTYQECMTAERIRSV